jgi:RNA polymerase sigma-70 factor (ECF subfamily)
MPHTDPGGMPAAGNQWFTTTHWSVVLTARAGEGSQGSAAVEKLCRTYWTPIYVYIRRDGYSPEDAQDLTQDFFARLLSPCWPARESLWPHTAGYFGSSSRHH